MEHTRLFGNIQRKSACAVKVRRVVGKSIRRIIAHARLVHHELGEMALRVDFVAVEHVPRSVRFLALNLLIHLDPAPCVSRVNAGPDHVRAVNLAVLNVGLLHAPERLSTGLILLSDQLPPVMSQRQVVRLEIVPRFDAKLAFVYPLS